MVKGKKLELTVSEMLNVSKGFRLGKFWRSIKETVVLLYLGGENVKTNYHDP